jgi:hypothetical protein
MVLAKIKRGNEGRMEIVKSIGSHMEYTGDTEETEKDEKKQTKRKMDIRIGFEPIGILCD